MFTPFHADGSLNLRRVRPMVDQLLSQGVAGLYVLGSTGEGPSLTTEERLRVAEAAVKAAAGRVPVIIQAGHNSLAEARGFAAHAQSIGADAVSATPAAYFKPESLDIFIECIAEIARGAPRLPFYYYNLPAFTGVRFDMTEFLRRGGPLIPNLRGIKFSDAQLHEFHACIQFDGGRYDILFGIDEMLLPGLVSGAQGAVGSTYNFAAPLYRRIIAAFERGDLAEAGRLQAFAVEMISTIVSHGGRGALKATMGIAGQDCGPSRLPIVACTKAQRAGIRRDLAKLGFFRLSGV
jgi:N-acetylneuraminate lyase